MNKRALFFLFALQIVSFLPALAQTIKGEVLEKESKRPVTGVSILNIYDSLTVTTNSDGTFVIAAASDQLLEFRKTGYKTVKVRIPKGYVPNYYKIIMEMGFNKVEDLVASTNRYDYRRDSIRYHDIYQHELDFPKLSGLDIVAHPFSALSKQNREIWKFQDDYNYFEKEKYVDRTFNEAIITKFTGLKGDSLHYYMKRYRPTYEELKGMDDYSFFTFIKKSVTQYRNRSLNRGRSAQ